MDARKFFFVSVGILALALAYQVGASRARADWDPGLSGDVVVVRNERAWDRLGRSWELDKVQRDWDRDPTHDLPVPVSEIKLHEDRTLITTADVAWVFDSVPGHWVNIGPYPGGPVAAGKQSFGKTKAAHR